MPRRVEDHPVLGTATPRHSVHFSFDGREISALEGDSIAAALLANDVWAIRRARRGDARGFFCGAGHCYECRVVVDGTAGRPSCLVPVCDGMVVERMVEGGGDGV
jgi:sarcosine oxidase subunit alpha